MVFENKLTMDQILTFIRNATLIKENDIMINLLKKSDSNKIIKSSFDFNFLYQKFTTKNLEELSNCKITKLKKIKKSMIFLSIIF